MAYATAVLGFLNNGECLVYITKTETREHEMVTFTAARVKKLTSYIDNNPDILHYKERIPWWKFTWREHAFLEEYRAIRISEVRGEIF